MNAVSTKSNDNIFAGIVGAFLFSLAGGILWFALYQIGYFASISGFVAVICAVKGYTFFTKSEAETTKCIVVSTITAAFVLVIAWYMGASYDLYIAYRDWYAAGEVDFTLTYFESVRALPYFFMDSEILLPYLGDLGLSMLFAVIGSFSYISNLVKRKKLKAAAMEEAKAAETIAPVSEEEPKTESHEVKNTPDAE